MFAELEACLAAAASPSQRNTEIKQKENICMQFNFLILSSCRLLPPPSFISFFSPKYETEVIPGTHQLAHARPPSVFTAWKKRVLRLAVHPLIKMGRTHTWASVLPYTQNPSPSPETQSEHTEVTLLSCFAAINSTLSNCALFQLSSPYIYCPLIHFTSLLLKSHESEWWLKG